MRYTEKYDKVSLFAGRIQVCVPLPVSKPGINRENSPIQRQKSTIIQEETNKEKSGLSKKDSEKAVNAAFDAISETLVEGGKVQLVGFGSFETKTRNARVGRNPRTKEEIEIPASRMPAFKAGKALKDAVAK